LTGLKKGEGRAPPQIFFLNFKSKNVAFSALISIDFKVCTLITETVYDHIRKMVTNHLRFALLFQSLKQQPESIAIAGTSSPCAGIIQLPILPSHWRHFAKMSIY